MSYRIVQMHLFACDQCGKPLTLNKDNPYWRGSDVQHVRQVATFLGWKAEESKDWSVPLTCPECLKNRRNNG